MAWPIIDMSIADSGPLFGVCSQAVSSLAAHHDPHHETTKRGRRPGNLETKIWRERNWNYENNRILAEQSPKNQHMIQNNITVHEMSHRKTWHFLLLYHCWNFHCFSVCVNEFPTRPSHASGASVSMPIRTNGDCKHFHPKKVGYPKTSQHSHLLKGATFS